MSRIPVFVVFLTQFIPNRQIGMDPTEGISPRDPKDRIFERNVSDHHVACETAEGPDSGKEWSDPTWRDRDADVPGNQGILPDRGWETLSVRRSPPSSFSLGRPQGERPPAIRTWIFSSSWRAGRRSTKERNASGLIFRWGGEVDVFVYTPEEWAARRERPDSFTRRILSEGLVLLGL